MTEERSKPKSLVVVVVVMAVLVAMASWWLPCLPPRTPMVHFLQVPDVCVSFPPYLVRRYEYVPFDDGDETTTNNKVSTAVHHPRTNKS